MAGLKKSSVAFILLAWTPHLIVAGTTIHGNWEGRDDFVELKEVADPQLRESAEHRLVFAVKQLNLAFVEALTLRVSDPNSAEYGEHLSHGDVHALTANAAAAAAVRAWCALHDLREVDASSHDNYITFTAQRSTWATLMRAKFATLQRRRHAAVLLRSRQFTMPDALEAHVSHIFNVVELPPRLPPPLQAATPLPSSSSSSSSSSSTACGGLMNVACWNERYNMTTNDASGQHQMVFGELNDGGGYMAPDDLTFFSSRESIPLQTFECPNGGCSTTACKGYGPNLSPNGFLCVEGNLDAQFISGIGQNANNTFYWFKDGVHPFVEFLTHVSSMSSPPGVLSMSYGAYEREMHPATMDAFSIEAMKLGAQGVSFLVATGDDGVAGYLARNDSTKCAYTVAFPASCPWVTSVGGTMNAEGGGGGPASPTTQQEWGANSEETLGMFAKITSAGGFSNHFPTANYQRVAVEAYLSSTAGQRAAGGYNASGRGIPDISANALNYQTWIDAGPATVSGTSGSAPAIAGMISVANTQRAKEGKSRLGFLNPLLYNRTSILNDIVHGYNNCTAGTELINGSDSTVCCGEGFTSAHGWDPVVGLGSPSYLRLLTQAAA